jgi:hypothetical protein
MGLETILAEFDPEKPPLLVANLSGDRDDLKLCGSLGRFCQKMVLGTSLPRKIPLKFLSLKPIPLSGGMIA